MLQLVQKVAFWVTDLTDKLYKTNERVTPTFPLLTRISIPPTLKAKGYLQSWQKIFLCVSGNAGFAQVVEKRVFAGLHTLCSSFKAKKVDRKRCPFPPGFLASCPQSTGHPAASPVRKALLSTLWSRHSQSFPVLKDKRISHLRILF